MTPGRDRAGAVAAFVTMIAVALLATGCGDTAPTGQVAATPTPTPSPMETATATPTASPTPTPTPIPEWRMYGKDPSRHRYLDADLKPPFQRRWTFKAGALLEFPPSLLGRDLWVLSDAGVLFNVDAHTGKVRWKRQVGQLAASSPAVTKDRVIVTILSRNDSYAGRVLAVRPENGKPVWEHDLPARTESSPVVADGNVYFGSENGTVYALKQSNGRELWRFQAGGAVKGGLALAGGRLYFGAYGGSVYALDQQTGKLVWRAGAGGNIYSTAAVGAGRVVLGSVGGGVYGFNTRTGGLAWSVGTGSYVYSSPAIAPGPGGKPTAFIGSYNGSVYAIDVRTGAVRWTASAGGRVSGGVSVIGRIAYVSELDGNSTSGFDVRTGRRVLAFPHGKFNPAISDGTALYLVGHGNVYKLKPKPMRRSRHDRRAARPREVDKPS